MRKLFIVLTTLVCCMSCGSYDKEPTDVESESDSISTTKIYSKVKESMPGGADYTTYVEHSVKGHVYLVVYKHNAISMIHAEHCPCKNK